MLEAVLFDLDDTLIDRSGAFRACVEAEFSGEAAEELLGRTIRKFIRRFEIVEEGARVQGKKPAEMSLAELDGLWEGAKRRERNAG